MIGRGTYNHRGAWQAVPFALAATLVLALSSGNGVAAGAQPDPTDIDATSPAPEVKLERFQLTPDGFSLSVDFLYPQDQAKRGKPFTVQDTQAVLDQILGPVFQQLGGVLSTPPVLTAGDQASSGEFHLRSGTGLGIWRPGADFTLSASAQRLQGLRAGSSDADPAAGCLGNHPAPGLNCNVVDRVNGLLRGNAFSDKLLKTYRLSAAWQPSESFSLGVDYYNSSAQGDVAPNADFLKSPALTTQKPRNRSNKSFAPLGSAADQTTLAEQLDAVSRGVDLKLNMGGELGSLGALAVHLKIRKVLDRTLGEDGKFIELMPGDGLLPDTDGAEFGVDWRKGNFSGGVTSRYFDDLQNNDRSQTWMTLDLQFKWNTPWNGSLEIGARNLLGADLNRLNDSTAQSNSELDRLLGRIPYVQYKQDL